MSGAAFESRASVLTPPGRGAVAVIAAEGPAALAAADAHFAAVNGRRLSEQTIGRILFGHWGGDYEAAAREEVIVCRLCEQQFEVHCHGGVAATERILAALAVAGCAIEPWRDWLRASGISALEADAEMALTTATTRRTAAILLDQRQGALADAVKAAIADLQRDAGADAREKLSALLAWAPLGRHLAAPWRVAIAGRPNVGKSSLINALVGYQRAIVFDQPGTTRDILAADTAIDGWPVRLTDSAGIRDAVDELEAEGVARARTQLAAADLAAWVLDATTLSAAELADPYAVAFEQMAADVGDAALEQTLLAIVNKIDLVASLPAAVSARRCVFVSAASGAGLDSLLHAISRQLVPAAPPPGAAVPFTSQQFDAIERAQQWLDNGNHAAAIAELDGILQGQQGA